MSAPRDLSERLLRLEQILADSAVAPGVPANGDAAELLLASVMTERIRKTTDELQPEAPVDAAAALAMRLALADYRAAVGQLRGVASTVERRLTAAAAAVRAANRDADRAANPKRR